MSHARLSIVILAFASVCVVASSRRALAQPATIQVETCSSQAALKGGVSTLGGMKIAAPAAIKVSEDILALVGITRNFEIGPGAVDNAEAFVCLDTGGKVRRYVVYRDAFMDDLEKGTTQYWAQIAVLAHEIGHHLYGHMLNRYGPNKTENHAMELGADRFSGFVMAKMGRSLSKSQSWLKLMVAPCPHGESLTHPCLERRLEAVQTGYVSANAKPAGPAPDPKFMMSRLPNNYYEGDGYVKSTVVSQTECEKKCLGDTICKAVEFMEKGGICQLYRAAGQAKPATGTHISLKVDSASRLASRFAMTPVENSWFEEHGYDKVANTTRQACEQRCLGQPRCQASEFQNSGGVCQLYDRVFTVKTGAGSGATVSLKRPG